MLTDVYFPALHQSLSDVLATRDKTSDGARHVVLLQDARDDLRDHNGAQWGWSIGAAAVMVARTNFGGHCRILSFWFGQRLRSGVIFGPGVRVQVWHLAQAFC